MSTIRDTIRRDIVNPAEHIRRTFTIVGIVTLSDERNNVCSVEFTDKDGYKSNRNNVPVKIYMPGFIGWFPKVGELVNIEQTDSEVSIVSKCEAGYAAATRPNVELKKDLLSNMVTDTMAGFIF